MFYFDVILMLLWITSMAMIYDTFMLIDFRIETENFCIKGFVASSMSTSVML